MCLTYFCHALLNINTCIYNTSWAYQWSHRFIMRGPRGGTGVPDPPPPRKSQSYSSYYFPINTSLDPNTCLENHAIIGPPAKRVSLAGRWWPA